MEAMQADLFVTCWIDSFFPEVGKSVVRVLRRAGVELPFPASQTCRSSTPASATSPAPRRAGLWPCWKSAGCR